LERAGERSYGGGPGLRISFDLTLSFGEGRGEVHIMKK